MGNRAVEMMVDTGAQTSAESLAKPPVLLVDTADIETCSLRWFQCHWWELWGWKPYLIVDTKVGGGGTKKIKQIEQTMD